MATTALGLSYPAFTDPPNIPTDIQALATSADTAITAAKPVNHAADASGATTINTTPDVDITGATVTFSVSVSKTLWIIGTWDCNVTAFTSATAFSGSCYVDGAALTGVAVWTPTANSQRTTISRSWITTVVSGSHTVKLTGRLSAANLTISAAQNNCGLTVVELS